MRQKVSFNMEPSRYQKLVALAEKHHMAVPTLVNEIVDVYIVTQMEASKPWVMPEHHYSESKPWESGF